MVNINNHNDLTMANITHTVFKRLRLILQGFVVTTHSSLCEHEQASGLNVLFPQALVHCDNKSRRIGLNHDYNIAFLISPENVNFLHLKWVYAARSKSRFTCYSHYYVMTLNDGYDRLTMPVVKRCCARDAPPDTFSIGVFISGKRIPTW